MIPRVGQDCDRCPPEVMLPTRGEYVRSEVCWPGAAGCIDGWLAAGGIPEAAFTERADPSGSVARGLEPSVMVPSLVVFIRVPSSRSETVVAAGLRSEEIRPDTSGRGAGECVR
jgi:hypothetical protein